MKVIIASARRSDRINIRGLKYRMAIATKPVGSLLIGNQEKEIGPCAHGLSGLCSGKTLAGDIFQPILHKSVTHDSAQLRGISSVIAH